MIPPLTPRLMLQTAVAETARLALEGTTLALRDQARAQALRSDLEATAMDIKDVAPVDPLTLADEGGQRHARRGPEEKDPGAARAADAATDAEAHLDVLA